MIATPWSCAFHGRASSEKFISGKVSYALHVMAVRRLCSSLSSRSHQVTRRQKWNAPSRKFVILPRFLRSGYRRAEMHVMRVSRRNCIDVARPYKPNVSPRRTSIRGFHRLTKFSLSEASQKYQYELSTLSFSTRSSHFCDLIECTAWL